MQTRNQPVRVEPSRIWTPMIDTWDAKLFSGHAHKPPFRELMDEDGEMMVEYQGDLNVAPMLPPARPLDLTRSGRDYT